MSQQPFKYHDVLYRAGVPCEVVRVLPDKLQLENMQTGEQSRVAFDRIAGALRTEE